MGSMWDELLGRICSQLDEDSLNYSVKLWKVALGQPGETHEDSLSEHITMSSDKDHN